MNRRTRVTVLTAVLVVVLAVLGFQAVTADPTDPATSYGGPAESNETLVTVQSYGWFDQNNGDAFIVADNGTKTWEFRPENARVFDAELLENGNVLVSYGTEVPSAECPDEYRNTERMSDHCVRNNVVEIDPNDDNEEVWAYRWHDAFIEWHEVHDADRLPNGETAIIDMGNDRAFTVDEAGDVTWEWDGREHLGPGSDFWAEHVPENQREDLRPQGPEDDWTHMNDIDQLANGNVQLSIRNFDVVIEVDPETDEIVDVVGSPGDHSVMQKQHNPNRLERHETMLIADSENDRVVEIDANSEEEVWSYDGTGSGKKLRWPRDVDRLPNGNSLVVDSRNFRVLEINPEGEVVWQHSLEEERGIVYDADRVGLPEEPDDVPSGHNIASRTSDDGLLADTAYTVESWAGFVFPPWVGVRELLLILVGLAISLALAVEGVLHVRARRADRV